MHASRNSPVLAYGCRCWLTPPWQHNACRILLPSNESQRVVLHHGGHLMCAWLQVPRILNPVVLVLDALPKHCKDPKLASYVNSLFGSVEGCRKAILLDFFRHAFDGSGADNFVSTLPAPLPCMSCTIPLCGHQRLCLWAVDSPHAPHSALFAYASMKEHLSPCGVLFGSCGLHALSLRPYMRQPIILPAAGSAEAWVHARSLMRAAA